MTWLKRSEIEPNWIEIHSDEGIAEEIEIRFPLRRFPKRFTSVEQAKKWLQEIEKRLAKNKALRLLSARSYPSKMLKEKLAQKGYSDRVCEEVAAELCAYLCDDVYTKQMIEREFRRGYGPRYIEMKLKSKGLRADVRAQITDEMQREKMVEMIRKLRARSTPQKMIQTLARRGFDLQIAIEILS